MRESACLFLVSTGFEHLDSHLIVRVGNSTTNEKSVKFSFLPFLELGTLREDEQKNIKFIRGC